MHVRAGTRFKARSSFRMNFQSLFDRSFSFSLFPTLFISPVYLYLSLSCLSSHSLALFIFLFRYLLHSRSLSLSIYSLSLSLNILKALEYLDSSPFHSSIENRIKHESIIIFFCLFFYLQNLSL